MKLRVLHISTHDVHGGAARAAYRLHRALIADGVDSRMLVGLKCSADPSVYAWGSRRNHRLRAYADRFLTMLAGGSRATASVWSNNRFPRSRYVFPDGWSPDMVNLHWVWGGFATLRNLARWSVPHLWTMHDMAALTGGCHLPGVCERFATDCGCCPLLRSRREHDHSSRIQDERAGFAARLQPQLVAPCRWIAQQAGRSRAFLGQRAEIIPNGISLSTYRPLDRNIARQYFHVPLGSRVVAFGALNARGDPNKGFDLFLAGLESIRNRVESRSIRVLFFGGQQVGIGQLAGFACHEVGMLDSEESLALAYSAADVFVAPSRQEVGPLTLVEAMACGTPGVGFAIGGVPDILDKGETGWVAAPFDAGDLGRGIGWCLDHPDRDSLRERCRTVAEKRFSIEGQARRYRELYMRLYGAG